MVTGLPESLATIAALHTRTLRQSVLPWQPVAESRITGASISSLRRASSSVPSTGCHFMPTSAMSNYMRMIVSPLSGRRNVSSAGRRPRQTTRQMRGSRGNMDTVCKLACRDWTPRCCALVIRFSQPDVPTSTMAPPLDQPPLSWLSKKSVNSVSDENPYEKSMSETTPSSSPFHAIWGESTDQNQMEVKLSLDEKLTVDSEGLGRYKEMVSSLVGPPHQG